MKRIELIGIRSTEKMKADLMALAQADNNRSLSSFVVIILQQYLDENKEKLEELEELEELRGQSEDEEEK